MQSIIKKIDVGGLEMFEYIVFAPMPVAVEGTEIQPEGMYEIKHQGRRWSIEGARLAVMYCELGIK